MKFYYDFHLHSCLSPCGDNDMTPYNLVNMAKLLGYDIIALTDHNSCLNCPAAIEAGKKAGVTVIAGMELCTAEEIHTVCLFPDSESALRFSEYVRGTMPPILNKPEIFGEQRVMNASDEVTGYEETLLTTASSIGIDDVFSVVRAFGGVCFPAHLDRASYSILSVLGFLYKELGFTAAEFTEKAFLPQYEEKHPLLKNMRILRNSDAHYLENMPEAKNTIELPEATPENVIAYLLGAL